MRKQMSLSRTVVLAIKEYKRIKFGEACGRVQNGFIIGLAYKDVLPKLSVIDWMEVSKAIIPNVTHNNDDTVKAVQTTVNLDASILQSLTDLKKTFINVFHTEKIYLPYVVKLVLFSAIILQNEGKLPTLQNDIDLDDEEPEQEQEALDYFYDEMLCNYDEDEKGEVYDGYDD